MAITSEDSFYILKFDRDAYVAALEAGPVGDEGVEDAFDLVAEISETYVVFILLQITYS